jgi:magnesium transporter
MEVAIYMGDVQGMLYLLQESHLIELCLDHILTLEHALRHYERMLSQSHPLYIAHVRATVAITKSGSDKAVIFLSGTALLVPTTLR